MRPLMEAMPADFDLERVYDEHAQAMFVYLLSFTKDEQDTRDILQEVFIKLARQPQLLAQARDQRAFLIRLTRNLAIDLTRRRAARQKHHSRFGQECISFFAPSADPDEAAFRSRVSAALQQLPADQREIVQLKLWSELTFEQIADALHISPHTAASRYRYGLNKLRDLLRPLYEQIR